jgi:prepilin-type N-terminal cleavage/methylation domain-containing protein
MSRRGFSLIELMAVLLIMGIMAGAVALRIQNPLRKARMADVTGSLEQLDRSTRHAARQQRRAMRIVFDRSTGTIARTDDQGHPAGSGDVVLPAGYEIEHLLVVGQDITTGVAVVRCTAMGVTPTYAMLLNAGGRRQWIVVAGLTGQFVQAQDERDARQTVAVTGRTYAR